MDGLENKLRQLIAEAAQINPDLIELKHPTSINFGDYTTNIALKQFGRLSQTTRKRLNISNSRDYAVYLINKIKTSLKDSGLDKSISVVTMNRIDKRKTTDIINR